MQILSPGKNTSGQNQRRPKKEKEPENSGLKQAYSSDFEQDVLVAKDPEKKGRGLKLGIAFLVVLLIGWAFKKAVSSSPRMPGYHTWVYTPEKYNSLLSEQDEARNKLAREFNEAESTEKAELIEESGEVLHRQIEKSMFPFWYGTRWGFHGTSETPGHGKIACGYFVTTVLRDAGVPIQRSAMAQAPSEQMIKSLVGEGNIKRYSGVDINAFVDEIAQAGDALYVVGLDTHTGFISCRGGDVHFIHSGGGFPAGVVRQSAREASALRKSEYRVTGCLTRDEGLLKNWLGV